MNLDDAAQAVPTGPTQAERFSRLWEDHGRRILAYATRQVGPHAAEEIVSETFLIAWRRLADVPGDPLPWLLVVARNTIRADRRSRYRARALEQELARLEYARTPNSGADDLVAERDAVLRGLAALTRRQREALLLIAWDGLSYEQAATVAGCSLSAFKVRVHRARDRLRRELDPPVSERHLSPETAHGSPEGGAIDVMHRMLAEGRTS